MHRGDKLITIWRGLNGWRGERLKLKFGQDLPFKRKRDRQTNEINIWHFINCVFPRFRRQFIAVSLMHLLLIREDHTAMHHLPETGDDLDGGMVGWLTEHGLMGAVDGLGANYRLIKLGRFLLQMPVI